MSEEYVKRIEHQDALRRIHERIDDISKSSTLTASSAEHIEDYAQKIHDAVYGNGKDGLLTKVAVLKNAIQLHFRLIMCIIGMLFTISGGLLIWFLRTK